MSYKKEKNSQGSGIFLTYIVAGFLVETMLVASFLVAGHFAVAFCLVYPNSFLQ